MNSLSKKETYVDLVLLLCLISIGTWLRYYKLGFQSFWLDELFTVANTRPDAKLADLWDQFSHNANPIFFFLLEWWWHKLVGIGDVKSRILPMLFGVATIPAMYYAGKSMFGRTAGLMAAFLLTVNSYHIEYSQEARSYTLLFLLSTLSFTCLHKWAKSNGQSLKPTIAMGLVHIIMLYTHYFSVYILLVHAVLFVLYAVESYRTITLRTIFGGFCGYIIPAIAFYPLLYNLLNLSDYMVADTQISDKDLIGYVTEFQGSNFLLTGVMMAAILYAAYFLFLKPIENRDIWLGLVVVFCWLFIGIMVPYAKSYLQIQRFHVRYFSAVYPSIILLVAYLFAQVKFVRQVGLFVLLYAFVAYTYHFLERDYYNKQTKADWRAIGEFMARNSNPNHVLLDISPDYDPLQVNYFGAYNHYAKLYGANFIQARRSMFFTGNYDGVWLVFTWWMPNHEEFLQELQLRGYERGAASPMYHAGRCELYVKKKPK